MSNVLDEESFWGFSEKDFNCSSEVVTALLLMGEENAEQSFVFKRPE